MVTYTQAFTGIMRGLPVWVLAWSYKRRMLVARKVKVLDTYVYKRKKGMKVRTFTCEMYVGNAVPAYFMFTHKPSAREIDYADKKMVANGQRPVMFVR